MKKKPNLDQALREHIGISVPDAEIKAFSITIEPMYVGKKKEVVVTVKKFNVEKDSMDLFQAIVPPRSRLDQEVKKLLDLKVIA